ncbi:hypothetical protein Tco_0935128 [Tanacetum coccineum]
MPRFSSNDMVHNHYLDEARKKTQERDRNSKTSVMPSARFQRTADGSKPNLGETIKHLGVCLYLRVVTVTITAVPKADHSKSSSSFSDSKNFILQDIGGFYRIVFDSFTSKVLLTKCRTKYFNGENQGVLKSSAVTTTDASNKRQQQPDSTSSTSTLATTVTANGNFDL